MGRQGMGQSNLTGQVQRMGSQMPKPTQDYASFQQQQMQHRYSQVTGYFFFFSLTYLTCFEFIACKINNNMCKGLGNAVTVPFTCSALLPIE